MYPYTTGLAGLDSVFNEILPGDNLVFEADDVGDYRRFVLSFAEGAAERGKEIVYFRFAGHEALLEAGGHVRIVPLVDGRHSATMYMLHGKEGELFIPITNSAHIADKEALFERLLRMTITRQQSFLPLARRYFDIPCLLDLMKRIIGSGLIGGKARGILLARRILREKESGWGPGRRTVLEQRQGGGKLRLYADAASQTVLCYTS